MISLFVQWEPKACIRLCGWEKKFDAIDYSKITIVMLCKANVKL